MTKNLGWEDVKWRSSIRVLSSVLKYHGLLTFIITVINVLWFNLLRFLISSNRSPLVNVWNAFLNVLPSFFFLLLLFCFRHISFKGCFVRSFYLEVCSLASNFLMVFAVLLTANSFIKLKVTEFRLFFVLTGCILHYLRVRHQNMDVCRVLDKQNVSTVRLSSYFSKSFFHCFLSYLITFVFFGLLKLVYLIGHSSFPAMDAYKYKNFLTSFTYNVNRLFSQLPYTTNYYHFSFSVLEGSELFLALLWTLSLSDYYLDMMNMESTHMDVYLMNYLEEMPLHNLTNVQDEMLFARAAYNYSKNVSYTLNSSSMRYVSNPPSLKLPEDQMFDNKRSNIQPFQKVLSTHPFRNSMNSNNTYTLEAKRDRYQLDSVVYKMLVDNSKNFWSNYVQSCLETMNESRLNLHHLIDYPFTKEQKINILDKNLNNFHHQNQNLGFYTSFQSFLLYVASYFKSFYTSKTLSINLINMLLLCIVYLRGVTSWLCIANMIGHDNKNVKLVSKDVIIQSLRIHKVLSTLNMATIPSYIRNYLETLNTDINTSLKKLAVFTETLLHSKFDTSFETYRMMEHLYNNRRLST